jgi:PhnB protein
VNKKSSLQVITTNEDKIMTLTNIETVFAPQLFIPSGVKDISFYSYAFGAKEINQWRNDDGTIHVAELSIKGTIFHLHEERPMKGQLEPLKAKGVTNLIGLFVENVDSVINNALKAGAILLNPAQDYDYGYRQGEIQDPFGHQWMIEMKI